MLSEAVLERKKETPESIMKLGTCFRLMELIKNVKYVLREVVLKASRWIIHHLSPQCRRAVKTVWHGTIDETIDTINLSQQSIWLCNQFFKKREEAKRNRDDEKRQIMAKLKWINLFNQSCKVCIKSSFIIFDDAKCLFDDDLGEPVNWTLFKFPDPIAISSHFIWLSCQEKNSLWL